MRKLAIVIWISLGGAILPAPLAAQGDAAEQPGYLPALKQELARLNLPAQCDNTALTCFLQHPLASPEGTTLNIVIRYSPETDTVYIYIDRYLVVGHDHGPDGALAKRLLALNNEMVTAKFEWDKPGGAIRLSTVVNTDSNFDRRAFRSQLKGLIKVAESLWPELNPSAASADAPPKAAGPSTQETQPPGDEAKSPKEEE